MNNLIIKDVDFQGASLKAVQNEDGKIYVAIRRICDGIGLSEGQMKSERKKLQEDLVLKQLERKFILPTSNGDKETICIELDGLPLWLAKISITPNMIHSQPELTDKLIEYQLKVRNALAEAFSNNNNVEVDKDEFKQIKQELNRIKFNHWGYVYFVKSDKFIKIGKTNNINQRLNVFGVKWYDEPELLFAIKTANYHELEKALHRRFYNHRVNGEWFNLNNNDLQMIRHEYQENIIEEVA